MNRILSLQFYLVSSSSAAPWPGALPLQPRDPNYGNGDTNTFSKRVFEQFTEYLTEWQICQLPLYSEGSKLFGFRGPSDSRLSAPRPPLTPPPTAKPLTSPLPHCAHLHARLLRIMFCISFSTADDVFNNANARHRATGVLTIRECTHAESMKMSNVRLECGSRVDGWGVK